MRASKEGHTATVQALVGAGADVNLRGKVSDDTQWVKQMRCVRPDFWRAVT
jgi:hypothetical protein